MSLIFEWDERKNQQNVTKHGIDFEDVKPMFDQPMLSRIDHASSDNELRWTAIGWMRATLCLVVFSEPAGNRIRLISARKATKSEAKQYGQIIRY